MCSTSSINLFNPSHELAPIFSPPASAEELKQIRNVSIRLRDEPSIPFSEIVGTELKDESSLIRTVYLCAQLMGRKTAKMISHFQIQDQGLLIFLTNTCAQSDGKSAKYIDTIGIENNEILNKIARDCLVNMSTAMLKGNHRKVTSAMTCSFIQNHCKVDVQFIDSFFADFLPGSQGFERPLKLISQYVSEQFSPGLGVSELVEAKGKIIRKYSNEHLSKSLTYWLGVAILILRQSDDETVAAFMKTKLVDAYLELRSPTFRVALTKDLSRLLCLSSQRIQNVFSAVPKNKNAKAGPVPVLVKMECALLEEIGINPMLLKRFQQHIPHAIKKDDRKLNTVIELLKFLYESTEITLETKEKIISKFVFADKVTRLSSDHAAYSRRIANFLTIFLFQEAHILNDSDLNDEALVNSLFVEKLKIPNDPYFIKKFQSQLIHHSRLKSNFAVFTGKIAGLGDPLPFQEIVTFIDAVIHDRFHEERQQIDRNSHMLYMRKHFPIVFDKWMQLQHRQLSDDGSQPIINFANSYIDFLCLGLEVIGSCMALDASPERTKAVMEGILNPKHQYIKIEASTGLIAARVKLSLLMSPVGPVCLIEDPYDNGQLSNSHLLLENAAIKVQEYLGIPLVTRKGEQYPWHALERFPHPLQSLASEYSYEYVPDTTDRTVAFGEYTIDADLWIVC